MLHFLAGLALCIFIGERLWHYRTLRRAASIILISCVVGMVLLFAIGALRSEMRSYVIRQDAAAVVVAPQCPPPTHAGEDISEGQKILEAYKCWP
jgi:biotin transporter BioY